jgi:hypothetical protein
VERRQPVASFPAALSLAWARLSRRGQRLDLDDAALQGDSQGVSAIIRAEF